MNYSPYAIKSIRDHIAHDGIMRCGHYEESVEIQGGTMADIKSNLNRCKFTHFCCQARLKALNCFLVKRPLQPETCASCPMILALS